MLKYVHDISVEYLAEINGNTVSAIAKLICVLTNSVPFSNVYLVLIFPTTNYDSD